MQTGHAGQVTACFLQLSADERGYLTVLPDCRSAMYHSHSQCCPQFPIVFLVGKIPGLSARESGFEWDSGLLTCGKLVVVVEIENVPRMLRGRIFTLHRAELK